MKHIKWKMHNGLVSCEIGGIIEIEDDMTDEDIENAVVDEMWNWVELSWKEYDGTS